MKKIILSIFPIAFLISCNIADSKTSSSVDQAKIQPGYGVNFNGSTHSGSVSAVFNLIDKGKMTQIKLDGKSNILCNGVGMNGGPIPILGGYSYDRDINSFQTENTFVYTDNDGKVYTNKISMQPFTLVGDPASWIDSSGEMYIPLSRSLEKNEQVHIYFGGDSLEIADADSQTKDEDADGYYDSTAKTIYLSPEFFKPLATSTHADISVTIKIDVAKNSQAPSSGGGSSISYEMDAATSLSRLKYSE